MTSQDTLNYAKSEEDQAQSLQAEIDKNQAEIVSYQNDINAKSQIIAGLQAKQQQHIRDGERLRKLAADEERKEQEEHQRQNDKSKDSELAKELKHEVKRGLFG